VRYFLEVSYNGRAYHGWQRQENANSVQEEIEKGLSTILRQQTSILGSGRTDTGVHAKKQVLHFDLEKEMKSDLLHKLNGILPPDIGVNSCRKVKEEAHARFSAERRGYHYYIHQKKTPFREGLSYFYAPALDVDLMNEAAKTLLGEQDFESFSKVKTEVNHFRCTLHKASWETMGDQLIFHVEANRFLRGMVRALVGTLIEVGRGKLSVEDFVSIIAIRDRTRAGAAVPAHGLFLTSVDYPEDIYL